MDEKIKLVHIYGVRYAAIFDNDKISFDLTTLLNFI